MGREEEPARLETKKAIAGYFYRNIGYVKIVQAIETVARGEGGEKW